MNAPTAMEPPLTERAVRIGNATYISEDHARKEADRLWSKVWQAACREEELEKPGDFVTYDVVDESIIVLRGTDGNLRAFHNQCRHRARRLTEGCGNKKRLVCPFHAWTWNLEGKNIGITREEAWGGV